ncbi:hypothetical protein ASG43_02485 [Aureimonas sp. Leaf454]|uniref:hypothetical protein n=1 Tax=Aureimonas sp. Leaf454 TaxID=1736381 RepID=UPI0006F32ACC|nr:hypothetical protein [Aureimonas sp. Leaf454]KQT54483.1 hypothetical protein ASG43_02485 [Aureimonas sp. Leaf454]
MSDTRKPDLLDNMIQRTDNAFQGVADDESLIGRDLPEEDEEIDERDLDEIDRPVPRSRDPKTL